MSDPEIGFWGGISQQSSLANALTCSTPGPVLPIFFSWNFGTEANINLSNMNLIVCTRRHLRILCPNTHYLGSSVFPWRSWQIWKLFVFLDHELIFLVYVWMALCDVGTGTCWRPYWHKHICGGWGSQPARNLACCPLPCFAELVYLYLCLSIKSSLLISHGHRWLEPSQYDIWLACS